MSDRGAAALARAGGVPTSLPGVLRVVWLVAALVALTLAVPAFAHKDHDRQAREQAEAAGAAPAVAPTTDAPGGAPQAHGSVNAQSSAPQADAPPSFAPRMMDWTGRLHPALVHFPVAFLFAGFFTALAGRRRPGLDPTTRFLVITGGLIAPIAALTGWLNGGWSTLEDDALMAVHRWLGTAIGVGGLAVALWAIARPGAERSWGMIFALLALALLVGVQGWYGGALVHGADHLAW